MLYQQLTRPFKFDQEKMKKVKNLFRTYKDEKLVSAFQEMKPWEYFEVTGGGLPEGCTYYVSVVRTQDKIYAYHGDALVTYDGETLNRNLEPTEDEWQKLFRDITADRIDYSHYDYLEIMLNTFWKLVFGKTADEMWCGGIVTSHGDKGYGYKSFWEKAGIPFNRGMLLFLLTYTKELGDTPKHMSDEWVVEFYPKYLDRIIQAEKELGLSI